MPATAPKNALAIGPGRLYYALQGVGLPSYTVTASVFTDTTWTGWSLLGITKSGSEFGYDITVDNIEAAEYLDTLAYVTTGRSSGITFEMMQIHATNLKRVLNGGTLTTSGSGTTLRSTYTPPQPGTEVRCQLGWQAEDDTERLYIPQAFQIGKLAVKRQKGSNVATLPVDFRFELDSNGNPFYYDTAGAIRG